MLRFERTNPLQLGVEELTARVALVYQQAAHETWSSSSSVGHCRPCQSQASLACGFFPDLWFDFSAWLDLGRLSDYIGSVLLHLSSMH